MADVASLIPPTADRTAIKLDHTICYNYKYKEITKLARQVLYGRVFKWGGLILICLISL